VLSLLLIFVFSANPIMCEDPDSTDFWIHLEVTNDLDLVTNDFNAYIRHTLDQVNRGNPDYSGEPEGPTPGRRCPACLERGDTVWVIPGNSCIICGTPVN
jgi:hypothetical protein